MADGVNGKIVSIGTRPEVRRGQKIFSCVATVHAQCTCGVRTPISVSILVNDQGLSPVDYECKGCGHVWTLRSIDYDLHPVDEQGNALPPRIHFGLKDVRPTILKPSNVNS